MIKLTLADTPESKHPVWIKASQIVALKIVTAFGARGYEDATQIHAAYNMFTVWETPAQIMAMMKEADAA